MFKSISSSFRFMSQSERIKFILLVLAKSLSGVLDILGIALIGILSGMAASTLVSNKPLSIFGFTLPSVTGKTLFTFVIVILGVFIFKAILAIYLGRTISFFIARIESTKSLQLARYIFTGTLGEVQQMSKGEILYAVTGSTYAAFSGLLTSVTTLASEGFLLALVVIAFIIVDPVATLFVVAYFGLIIGLIQLVIGNSLKKAGQNLSTGSMESATAVNDVVDTFREITVFHKQEHFLNIFNLGRSKVSKSNATLIFLGSMPRYIVETFLMLGVVVFIGWQFATGNITSGFVTVGVFVTGGVRIMASLLPLQNAVANIKTQTEQSNLAYKLLAEEQDFANNNKFISTSHHKQAPLKVLEQGLSIELDAVSFRYPDSSVNVINEISLSISPGQHVAFIGPSGAGKTTLVDLMLGLITPQNGSVNMGGFDPREIIALHPGAISYVPQSPGIVSGTIAENIALGISNKDIDFKKLNACVEAAFLSDFIATLPDGINTSVGKQADALSGGQIQRLGLARALYEEPKLIILDEATSALDASSEAFISQSLANLGKDVTVIVIAHRLSTVQHSDVVFVVEGGQITASGKFAELRERVPMVADYVKLMSFDD